jgi:hypothetical protein
LTRPLTEAADLPGANRLALLLIAKWPRRSIRARSPISSCRRSIIVAASALQSGTGSQLIGELEPHLLGAFGQFANDWRLRDMSEPQPIQRAVD